MHRDPILSSKSQVGMLFLYDLWGILCSSLENRQLLMSMWPPVLPKPGIMVYLREIIPFYGPTIQVSEI
jgi:hypothetical protein